MTDTYFEAKKRRGAKNTSGIKQVISDELVLKAEGTKDRIGRNFGTFILEKGWTGIEAVRNLYPIVKSSSHISKLLSGDNGVSLALLVVLHDVYGVDLNEFIAGDKIKRPPLTPEQVQTLRDIVQMYD